VERGRDSISYIVSSVQVVEAACERHNMVRHSRRKSATIEKTENMVIMRKMLQAMLNALSVKDEMRIVIMIC